MFTNLEVSALLNEMNRLQLTICFALVILTLSISASFDHPLFRKRENTNFDLSSIARKRQDGIVFTNFSLISHIDIIISRQNL